MTTDLPPIYATSEDYERLTALRDKLRPGPGARLLFDELARLQVAAPDVEPFARLGARVRYLNAQNQRIKTARLVMPKEETLTVLFAKSKSRAKGRENMAKAAGKTLFEGLLARKILVRNYSQHPLLPGALRISTGTLEENARIIEAVKEILEG